ncbi:hypothetical protein [Lactococcus protaetiae]|nr:hypothetical protein [Lactococcus protaetiae]
MKNKNVNDILVQILSVIIIIGFGIIITGLLLRAIRWVWMGF